jgi:Spy/CpxP family protein refolding chaperone
MKHTKSITIATAAALLLLAVAPVALGQQAAPPKPGPFLKCLSILGLSDTQKADIKQVLETEKPVVAGLVATLKTDGAALKAALEQNPPNGCAIGTALLKVQADKTALRTEAEKIRTNVEALLTAEQKAKLEGCLQAHRPPVAAAAADEEDDLPTE